MYEDMQAVCMITVILLCCAQEAGGIWNAPYSEGLKIVNTESVS